LISTVNTDVAPIELDADKRLVKGDAQTLGEIDNRVSAIRPDPANQHGSAPALVDALGHLHCGRRKRSRDRLTQQVDIALAQGPQRMFGT
jgi:hypothetical protein